MLLIVSTITPNHPSIHIVCLPNRTEQREAIGAEEFQDILQGPNPFRALKDSLEEVAAEGGGGDDLEGGVGGFSQPKLLSAFYRQMLISEGDGSSSSGDRLLGPLNGGKEERGVAGGIANAASFLENKQNKSILC